MIECTLISLKTQRTITKYYNASQLLDFYDEEQLVIDMSICNCQPVGETYVVDCNCDSEWEYYQLIVGGDLR